MGSHLTDKLMMDGHEVTVVDNFFTGRKRNVEHWIGHENFELINHDVVEPLYIEGNGISNKTFFFLSTSFNSAPSVYPVDMDMNNQVSCQPTF